ncbi:MAG: hypothetical protein ACK4S2_13350 [Gemmobacter sp.]|uniref:hypothetical protein n=1 Tax=Gemmobacter sp. TaxID=1898957 RepID=UPI00391CE9E9
MMDKRLRRLAEIAAMIREAKLAELSRRAQVCQTLQDRLAGLDASVPVAGDLSFAAIESVALRHERWAAPRRMMLNEQLATARAARMAAESEARAAFGRALVLERLRDRGR